MNKKSSSILLPLDLVCTLPAWSLLKIALAFKRFRVKFPAFYTPNNEAVILLLFLFFSLLQSFLYSRIQLGGPRGSECFLSLECATTSPLAAVWVSVAVSLPSVKMARGGRVLNPLLPCLGGAVETETGYQLVPQLDTPQSEGQGGNVCKPRGCLGIMAESCDK